MMDAVNAWLEEWHPLVFLAFPVVFIVVMGAFGIWLSEDD